MRQTVDALFRRRQHGDSRADRSAALAEMLALYYAADTATQVRVSIEMLLWVSDGLSLSDRQIGGRAH